MEQIWAPWRMEYIRMEKPKGCFLCDEPNEHNDECNYILYRGEWNFVMMNNYPYNPGHLLVAPYRHIAHLDKLPKRELYEHTDLVTKSIKVLKNTFNPTGFNVGMNIGHVAGAGQADHIHTHIVPRWQGDTNFMPVIGGLRVIPEAVADTYQQLKSGFSE
jgi:ATP adenylyltransferase